MTNNFVAKIIKESALVYDIRTKRASGDGYMILQVEKSKHSAFQKKMEGKEPFDATDYGEILYQGLGEPSDELKQLLNEKYGMYS
jgi:hypothetical protein